MVPIDRVAMNRFSSQNDGQIVFSLKEFKVMPETKISMVSSSCCYIWTNSLFDILSVLLILGNSRVCGWASSNDVCVL